MSLRRRRLKTTMVTIAITMTISAATLPAIPAINATSIDDDVGGGAPETSLMALALAVTLVMLLFKPLALGTSCVVVVMLLDVFAVLSSRSLVAVVVTMVLGTMKVVRVTNSVLEVGGVGGSGVGRVIGVGFGVGANVLPGGNGVG